MIGGLGGLGLVWMQDVRDDRLFH